MLNKPNITSFPSLSDVEQSLVNGNYTCIYYLPKEGRRCKNHPNRDDRASAFRISRSLDPATTLTLDIEALKDYARLNGCKRWHRSMLEDQGLLGPLALKWQAEIHARSTTSCKLEITTPLVGPPPADVHLPPSPQKVSCTPQRHHRYNLRSSPIFPEQNSTTSELNDASGFRPHLVSPSQTVATVLTKPLTPRDLQSGILYLYTRSSSPGFVKIGLTTVSIQSRFNAWSRECGYTPLLADSFDNVPHIYRVEQLVHFELAKHWRVEKQCQKCSRQHREWFEITTEEAVRIAGLWAEWMSLADPYGSQGMLKEVWRAEIQNLRKCGLAVTARALLDIHIARQRQTTSWSQASAQSENSSTDVLGTTERRCAKDVPQLTSIHGVSTPNRSADDWTTQRDGLSTMAAGERTNVEYLADPDMPRFESNAACTTHIPASGFSSGQTSTGVVADKEHVNSIADAILDLSEEQQDRLALELVRRSSTLDVSTARQGSSSACGPERLDRHNTNMSQVACA